MRGRVLKEQGGFTLPEMMVTILVMVVVLFALFNIFDASVRVFSLGNDKVEAVENARLGLEKMEREIRAAYPVKGPTGVPRYRFFSADGSDGVAVLPPQASPTSTQITFGNELGASGSGDQAIRCPAAGTCEYITYKLTGTPATPGGTPPSCSSSTAPCTLRRVNAASSAGAGEPVVEFVRPPIPGDANRYGLRFRYFNSSGTELASGSPQADIARVEVALQIEVDKNPNDGQPGRTQNLLTEINLRNPGTVQP